MTQQDYRHVCFKDLENYFKKDEYFGDLSDLEKQQIRENLGIQGSSDIKGQVVKGSYDYIKGLVDTNVLTLGSLYIIDDFQTIYESGGEVLGTSDSLYPSAIYNVVLTPTSDNTFDRRVGIICSSNLNSTKWIVEYDFTQERVGNVLNKGTILYLKDENNNYAYYDFKNVRFKRTQSELDKGPTTLTEGYYYTFSRGKQDNSSNVNCKNNHLEKGCTNIVFLGTAQNNTFEADSHNITFFKLAENNKFYYGTRNDYFIDIVRQMKGAVHDRTLEEITAISCPKEFNVLMNTQVIVYLDPETKTFQVEEI